MIGGPFVLAAQHSQSSAASGTSAASRAANWANHSTPASAAPVPNYCGKATAYERQASSDLDSRDFRGAYHNSASGLSLNASCSDETDRLVNRAYLLSMKGLAEHYISVGDSRTDLNEANMLLVQCQTRPGLYGTHEGAECETQENNNIRSQSNWDLGN